MFTPITKWLFYWSFEDFTKYQQVLDSSYGPWGTSPNINNKNYDVNYIRYYEKPKHYQ